MDNPIEFRTLALWWSMAILVLLIVILSYVGYRMTETLLTPAPEVVPSSDVPIMDVPNYELYQSDDRTRDDSDDSLSSTNPTS